MYDIQIIPNTKCESYRTNWHITVFNSLYRKNYVLVNIRCSLHSERFTETLYVISELKKIS